jgi:hypothetical protein
MKMAAPQMDWTRAVVRVGDGRGFVIGTDRARFVVTAGHCLPELPPFHALSHLAERTWKLLGPLGGGVSVWAECLFADPIADLAVLGQPDIQELGNQWEAYQALVHDVKPFPIGRLRLRRPRTRLSSGDVYPVLPQAKCPGWILSLDGQWLCCEVQADASRLMLGAGSGNIGGGMSGSPIVMDDGSAIGVVTIGTLRADGNPDDIHIGPSPFLSRNLPSWLLAEALS